MSHGRATASYGREGELQDAAVRSARAHRRALAGISIPSRRGWWRLAQAVGLASMAGANLALLIYPREAPIIFWNAIIPLLPATFVLAPSVWRSVCPLASLNMMGAGISTRRLDRSVRRSAGLIGIVLLLLLIPTRHLALNTQAAILVAAQLGLAVIAAACGVMFDAKAGFCNSVCPILPVERLYGQRPLFDVGNQRCAPCSLCTPRGCIDLSPKKSLLQLLGPTRRTNAWLGSAFGAFACSFPGFILGYFETADTTVADAGHVYGVMLLYALVSYGLTSALIRGMRIPSGMALPALAATSAVIYYWNAAPRSMDALGAAPLAGLVLRWFMTALVVVWGLYALSTSPARRATGR